MTKSVFIFSISHACTCVNRKYHSWPVVQVLLVLYFIAFYTSDILLLANRFLFLTLHFYEIFQKHVYQKPPKLVYSPVLKFLRGFVCLYRCLGKRSCFTMHVDSIRRLDLSLHVYNLFDLEVVIKTTVICPVRLICQ